LSLHEVDEAASIIKEAADPQANIILGHTLDPDLEDDVMVTVIATGFEPEEVGSKPAVIEKPATRVGRASQQVLAAVQALTGEAARKDLDRPTFLRRFADQRETQERLGLTAEEEWDVPTFLRKQSD
ncbi:MAG: cell division protein FtsZ, partial [Acidimicrobiia bacterium]